MNVRITNGAVRMRLGAAAVATAGLVLTGCGGTTPEAPTVVTEVVTQTADAPPTGSQTTGSETTGTSTSTGTTSGQTEVITVVAVNRDGTPASGWTVDSSGIGSTVSCGPPMMPSRSATSNDIYSCSPSAAGAHTCWPTPASSTTLYCLGAPWDRTLRQLTSDVPLQPVTKPADPQPLALELANGIKCTIRTGGAWGGRSDGYLGAYGCADTNDVVLAKDAQLIDTSGAQWTVKTGPLGVNDAEFPPPATVGVVRAYYAGTQN